MERGPSGWARLQSSEHFARNTWSLEDSNKTAGPSDLCGRRSCRHIRRATSRVGQKFLAGCLKLKNFLRGILKNKNSLRGHCARDRQPSFGPPGWPASLRRGCHRPASPRYPRQSPVAAALCVNCHNLPGRDVLSLRSSSPRPAPTASGAIVPVRLFPLLRLEGGGPGRSRLCSPP